MVKIVAIGGGSIGFNNLPPETSLIDEEIILLTGKDIPKVLFIPTASSDDNTYIEAFRDHYQTRLSCKVDDLCLLKDRPPLEEIKLKIFSSDIIYVGGGNTLKMMKVWKKYCVDKLLKQAYRKSIVMSGLSAGAICWFSYGNSDSMKYTNPKAGLIRVSGLGIINCMLCPHYDVEEDRKPDLKKMMKKYKNIAIALDNCCAIEIIDRKYRIIKSAPDARAYKVFWKNGVFYENVIEQDTVFRPLGRLLRME